MKETRSITCGSQHPIKRPQVSIGWEEESLDDRSTRSPVTGRSAAIWAAMAPDSMMNEIRKKVVRSREWPFYLSMHSLSWWSQTDEKHRLNAAGDAAQRQKWQLHRRIQWPEADGLMNDSNEWGRANRTSCSGFVAFLSKMEMADGRTKEKLLHQSMNSWFDLFIRRPSFPALISDA